VDHPAGPVGARVLAQTLVTVPPTVTAPDQSTPLTALTADATETQTSAGPADVPHSRRRRRGLLLVLLAIMLIGVNLRITITSLGALLDQVATDLHLATFTLGVLTALPAAAFATVGALTGRLHRRFGPGPLLLVATALVALGQLARAFTGNAGVFLVSSAAALAGIAVGNVLLPVLIKQYFPNRIGLVTAGYTGAMTVGSTVAAATAVPVAAAAGSWRVGLVVWAVPAMLAVAPVLALRSARSGQGALQRPRIRVGRTRLGWAMAVFFGLQSFSGYALMGWLPHLYRDAGFSDQTAGLLLALVVGAGAPVGLAMPWIAARRADQRPLVVALATTMLVAYAGLAVAPHAGALVWTGLLAAGQGSFPLALALLGLRARTMAGTAALSGFAQSTGYAIGMVGPLSVGLLYRFSGGFLVPLGALALAMVLQAVAGLRAARPGMLEDELATGVARNTAGADKAGELALAG
jgi:MFS transporter, CP family, cyanate transporter